MKHILVTALVLVTAVASAATNRVHKTLSPEEREKRLEAFNRQTGGYVVKPDPGNGRILVANAQKRVPARALSRVANIARMRMKLPVECAEVEAAKPSARAAAELKATLVVFVTDNPSSGSTILTAPDERWAVVNVAAVGADAPDSAALENRVRRAVSRAIGILCGAGGSQYADSLAGAFLDGPKDYDRFRSDLLPPDTFQRILTYVGKLGIRPVDQATYLTACQEGWAPQPTNDVQKAIWQKVHEVPSKPLKIKYDANKQPAK